jgi:UDP-N-acetylglucosamine:LPS N-acetylglucosamine transferase
VTVVIAGGGTGGHLYPGLAVARALLARVPEARVSFAGTARGLEGRVVPQEGFELDVIRSSGLKGKSPIVRLREIDFDTKRQIAEIDYVMGSQAAMTSLAENYAGLPIE